MSGRADDGGYVVGDFMRPAPATDELFSDYQAAYDRMIERSAELENFLVGLWPAGNDYAACIAINGEIFRAV